jgi:hypothetical protein
VSTLRTALEHNPSVRELHFDIALALTDVSPDADQAGAEEIIYHLRRAFVPGDKNYQAQFLYARELCIVNKYEDARPIFATLAEARVPFQQKTEVGNYVMNSDGSRRRMHGSVTVLKPSYGFLQCNSPALSAYFDPEASEVTLAEIQVGVPVSFELGFNLRGPVATNIQTLK